MGLVWEDLTRFFGGTIGLDSLTIDDSPLLFAIRFCVALSLFYLLFSNNNRKNCQDNTVCKQDELCNSGKCVPKDTCAFDYVFLTIAISFFLSWGFSIAKLRTILLVPFASVFAISFVNLVL